MTRVKTLLGVIVSAVFVVSAIGLWAVAADAIDPSELAAHQQGLTLSKAPTNAQSVRGVRKQLEAAQRPDGSANLREVAVAGQIGGMPNPWGDTHPDFPWYAEQASFFLLDNKVATQFASHAKHHGGDVDCPFCRRLATRNVNAVAVVNLVDDQGEILKVDARELMNLKEGQRIVVRGKAEMLGGNFVVIHADGIYVRPQRK